MASSSWTASGRPSDDGTCAFDDDTFDGAYRYSSDLDGYGPSWVGSAGGEYYYWGQGSFSGDSFTYVYGYVDYPYGGTYYTYYQVGEATVQ